MEQFKRVKKEGLDYPLYTYYLITGMIEELTKMKLTDDTISFSIPLPYFYGGITLARKTIQKMGYECSLCAFKKDNEKYTYQFRVKTTIARRK